MGPDAAHREGVGRIPPQGGPQADGEENAERTNIGWVYPPLEDAMKYAGLQEEETYVSCHQNTVSRYIATRPITDLCLAAKRSPGPRVANMWWE